MLCWRLRRFYLKEVTWPVQGCWSCPAVHSPDLTVGSAQHRQLWRRELGQEQRNSDCTQIHPSALPQGCCSWHTGRREQERRAAEGSSCCSQLSVA